MTYRPTNRPTERPTERPTNRQMEMMAYLEVSLPIKGYSFSPRFKQFFFFILILHEDLS